MMREIFPFLTAAGLLLILAFTAILLVRKRMQRGEIVQAVVKKAEINDSDPNRRLRELPTGRSLVMPILLYAFGLSFLVLAGGFAAVFSRCGKGRVAFTNFAVNCLGGRRLFSCAAALPLQRTY